VENRRRIARTRVDTDFSGQGTISSDNFAPLAVPIQRGSAPPEGTCDLIAALFVAQQERPSGLTDVRLADLPPELRIMLCHDGTLTTALRAHRLGPVAVEVLAQGRVQLDDTRAGLLRAVRGDEAIFRKVAIHDRASSQVLVHAESLLLLHRLPESFPQALATSGTGIGGALARLELESRRDLLWCGRTADGAVVRCYRVVCREWPVLLIEESFPL
jgi:chorismate-pyruvate lyase